MALKKVPRQTKLKGRGVCTANPPVKLTVSIEDIIGI